MLDGAAAGSMRALDTAERDFVTRSTAHYSEDVSVQSSVKIDSQLDLTDSADSSWQRTVASPEDHNPLGS